MKAITQGGIAEIAALTDGSPEPAKARRTFFGGPVLASLANLMEVGVDGMVIAMPGASYAENAENALEPGVTWLFSPTDQSGSASRGATFQRVRPTFEPRKESPFLHESS